MTDPSYCLEDGFIRPHWPAPGNVHCLITTRLGGGSISPYDSNNLALHVGDNPETVRENRKGLISSLPLTGGVQWLQQIHGVKVVEASSDGKARTADGCITGSVGLACAVMTADCLPLLICDRAGTRVAAIHAGWRGLADGIIANAVAQFEAPAKELLVYLGPAIGAKHFEVGVDVLEAFYESAGSSSHVCAMTAAFTPSALKPMKYLADIYALARAALHQLGVTHIYGGDCCTYTDAQHFYSYRRDGNTGRMAALIWLS